MYRKIVVGTDFSATAERAVARAAWLSEQTGATLRVVHAGAEDERLAELGARYKLEAVAREGNPAEVLVSEAGGDASTLLVVGNVGMSGARRFFLGSIPNKVSHHSSTDLLIVKTDRPGSNEGYERLLVGTDGSETASRAVERMSQLSATLGAKLTIACAYEPPTDEEQRLAQTDPNDPVEQWGAGRAAREIPDEFRWRIAAPNQAEEVLEAAAEHAARHGASYETTAREGHPAEVLISMAENEGYDVIATGSVGMSGARRFMLGNVPNRVSHHAPTDLLILRTR